MQGWAEKLDAFLAFNEHQVLQDAGKVTAEVAKQLAEKTYESFAEQRRLEENSQPSDFDAFVAKSQGLIKHDKQ